MSGPGLSAAFLVCHLFVAEQEADLIKLSIEEGARNMRGYNPAVHIVLGSLGSDPQPAQIAAAARVLSNVSSRAIPLAECLREQYATRRIYLDNDYPRPPYTGDTETRR